MAKQRLNKEERRVIIRKIQDSICKKYEEDKKKVNDSYTPSIEYKSVEDRINKIKENLLSLVKDKYCSSSYVSSIGYANSECFGNCILEEIKEKELGDKYPKYVRVNDQDIEDDLILTGIDPDWSVDDIINKYVNKYTED